MAEGLLQGENMEDDGEKCFKTLISRSLFQRSAQNESSVVMHDLVHDLATFVSGKDFCIRLNDEDNGLRSLTDKTRHLLYEKKLHWLISKKLPELKDFEGLSEENCVRSFIALTWSIRDGANLDLLLKKLQWLRALCLSNCSIVELPESIGKLKHLRYLDLSHNIQIKRLPDAVCILYNLQTLLLNYCMSLTELPANMGRLLNLRYLDLSCTKIKRLPDAVCSLYNLQTLLLNHCGELTELPANMGRLNLRHLHLRWTHRLERMPLSNWNLKGLRTLTKLVLNDEHSGSKIKELKEHYSDGSFEIVGLENVVNPNDVLEAEFEKKSGITEIILKWSSSRSNLEKDRATLDAFKPHVSLKKLNIEGYAGSLDGSFRCLKELRLYNCRQMEVLSCGQMNTTFPSLVNLKIDSCPKLEITGLPLPSSLENLHICDSEKLMAQRMQWGLLTTSLKVLRIKGCNKDLMDTFPEEGLLPTTLQKLTISNAPNMKALNGNAFQHLTSLTDLFISSCLELECLPEQGLPASLTYLSVYRCPQLKARLQRETGQDWHKISHIRTIRVN